MPIEKFKGTGHNWPDDDKDFNKSQYIGTAVCNGGQLVWHVFEVVN